MFKVLLEEFCLWKNTKFNQAQMMKVLLAMVALSVVFVYLLLNPTWMGVLVQCLIPLYLGNENNQKIYVILTYFHLDRKELILKKHQGNNKKGKNSYLTIH